MEMRQRSPVRSRQLIAALLFASATMAAQERTNTDWPTYGNDAGGSRYSPLALIDRSNVTKLTQAWIYHTHALEPETKLNRKAAFETTPIVMEGIMYLSTPLDRKSTRLNSSHLVI